MSEAQEIFQLIRDRGRFRRWEIAELAAADVNVFAEYCFNVRQEELHKEWHELADTHNRLVLWSPPEHGKTFQFGTVRMAWSMGLDPNITLAHFSNTAEIPEASITQLARHLGRNERIRHVFPNLRMRRFGRTGSGVAAIWLERSVAGTDRDPSMVAMGVLGQVLGRRLDGILLDDILDFDNTYTKTQREKINSRLEDELLTRLMFRSWLVYIGHPWFKDDAGHHLAMKENYHHRRYDAECSIDGAPGPPGLWPHAWRDPESGKLYGWPWERLMSRKDDTDLLTWERVWRCRTPSTEQALFKMEDLRRALHAGRGLRLSRQAPEDTRPVSGVDIATGDGRDQTSVTTVCWQNGKIQLLDQRGGLWDDSRLYVEMRNVIRLYPEHAGFLVEDNAMQKFIVNTTGRYEVMRAYGWDDDDLRRLTVRGFTTGSSKFNETVGIRSMAVDFQQDRFILPSDDNGKPDRALARLIDGLAGFDPDDRIAHTPDEVISFWLAHAMLRKTGQGGRRHLGIS